MGERSKVGQAAIIAALLVFSPVFGAEPFKDFTFRLVKPPLKGTKKLITIQVQSPKPSAKVAITSVSGDRTDLNEWFWRDISADLAAAGPGRFNAASDQLAKKPPGYAMNTPSLERFRQISLTFGKDILLATIGKKISPALVLAMIGVESSGHAEVASNKGTVGLMQITPRVAARFGVSNPFDPAQNIRAGVSYLASLLKQYDNDPILALAAYNAGEAAVASNAGVPPFAETRAYVPRVVAAFQTARALCLTPPELFSDGCVFSLKDSTK
ncbi:MAG: lytic transglycosylase domain-containing protein [Alphaproteobacteria bacterium]|nr:lytic transglycosylase domain-containing protein [Alphaproteobacteria bacterium]